jgi:hypothetical protein
MIKVRTLSDALGYLKSLDADTAISANAIRMLVVSGTIPSVKAGKKYLINVDTLVNYFEDKLSGNQAGALQRDSETWQIGDDIRQIPERLKRREIRK